MFGKKGREAACKETRQMHKRVAFEPVDATTLSHTERKRAMESLMLLTEKRIGSTKGRATVNGSTQRACMHENDASSPTANAELILLASAHEVKEERDAIMLDVLNTFLQTSMPKVDSKERVIMKLRGALADMLLEIEYDVCSDCVAHQNNKKASHANMLKLLHRMLKASLPHHKQFVSCAESIGHAANPCNPCAVNKTINNKKHALAWHVDDVKSAHADPKANDRFAAWAEEKHWNKELSRMTVTRGKQHDYLGMTLNFTKRKTLKADATEHGQLEKDFPGTLRKEIKPWGDKLAMKIMFLCKRGRLDVEVGVSFLTA